MASDKTKADRDHLAGLDNDQLANEISSRYFALRRAEREQEKRDDQDDKNE
jgi:hypothetical protein